MAVPVILVAHHAVHGVDGLVGQRQGRAAQQHVEQRRGHPVGEVLRHRLHRRLGHLLRRQRLRIPAHDAADGLPGPGQIALFQPLIYPHALLRQPLQGQGLPAPDGLQQEPRRRMEPPGQTARAAADRPCPQGQRRRQDAAGLPLPLRRLWEAGPQLLFQRVNGLAHADHRMGHPVRVRQQQVQGKAAQGRCEMGHTLPPFLYCTVRKTVSVRSCSQREASST